MSARLLAVGCVSAAAAFGVAQPPSDLPRTNDPKAAAVFVDRTDPGGGGSSGSGTVVACSKGQSLVLTNHHVAPRPGPTYVVVVDDEAETEHPATWVAGTAEVDKGGPDLGLLRVKAELPVAKIGDAAAPAGAKLRRWGGGTGPRTATVVGTKAFETPAILLAGRSVGGDSGAGLFDAKGFLVGVHWGRSSQSKERYAAKLSEVRKFLRANAAGFPDLAAALDPPE